MAPRVTAALLLTLLLAACAAPQSSFYAPKDSRDGYAEQALGKGLYRVSFQGNHVTSRKRVQEYALYRAAELTLEMGGERFAVHDKQTDQFTQVTREYYGGWGYYPYGYGRSPGHSYQSERTSFLAAITIEPLSDETPAAQEAYQVYDAREVIRQFTPRVERPAVAVK